jgi:hypothetical protein
MSRNDQIVDEATWDSAAFELTMDEVDSWLDGESKIDRFLSPLTQILLALRTAQCGTVRQISPEPLYAPILHQALRHYAATDAADAFIHSSDGPTLLWAPASRLYTTMLTDKFGNQIARMLHRLELLPIFSDLPRQYLLNLIFHPLQNTQRHGKKRPAMGSGLSGISMRVAKGIYPLTPSSHSYLTEVIGPEWPDAEFLEVIIHDDGQGIAEHYRQSRIRNGSQLQQFDVSREWVWLKRAFERHASSRYFRESVDAVGYQPGIGLASMLAAAKHLRCFVEVRAGRLRAYQYFRQGEQISRSSLLRPDNIPSPGVYLPGTVIRFFIPLTPSQ